MAQPAKARERFLEALGQGHSVTLAADMVGVGRRSAYRWRAEDADFAASWEESLQAGADRLEDEARRRAFDGSDALLKFLLQARRPQQFRERASFDHVVTKAPEPPPVPQPFADMSDEELLAEYQCKFGQGEVKQQRP